MMKTGITAHVLDLIQGCPAIGVNVSSEQATPGNGWRELGSSRTDIDGRVGNLLPRDGLVEKTHYRLTFGTGAYFRRQEVTSFYPFVQVVFDAEAGQDIITFRCS